MSSLRFQSNFLQTYAPPSKWLGAGSFGIVVQAKHKNKNNLEHAIKRISLEADPTESQLKEVTVAMTLKHKNIVRYISHWQEKPPEGKQWWCRHDVRLFVADFTVYPH
jgi:serine/threonine protein kinase